MACDAAPEAPQAPEAGDQGAATSSGDDASMAAQPQDDSPSYAAVAAIFRRSCGFARCHSPPVLGGGLNFAREVDYHPQLVGVPACEYDRMKRVEPGQPERSWLMVKLTAAVRPSSDKYGTYIEFEPASDWDPSQRPRLCRLDSESGEPLFGWRMPATTPNMLREDEIEVIRAWIADGAPH
jgi:hypothetical protein